MPHVICQALFRIGRMTFVWSEGGRSFEPYALEGADLESFLGTSRHIRSLLAQAAQGVDVAGDIGKLGQTLHRLLFQGTVGQEVLGWLKGTQPQPLEILCDAPGIVPWQTLCDDAGPAEWSQCWGVRYPLAVGRRIDAQRGDPYTVEPKVMLAIEPDIEEKLPASIKEQLLAMLSVQTVRNWLDLDRAIRRHSPDVLVWVGNVKDGEASLGGEAFAPAQLAAAIADAEAGSPFPTVVLLGEGNAETATEWELFLAEATTAMSSIVACETPLPGDRALDLALGFLKRFVERKLPLGEALRELRADSGPFALALAGYAPAFAQVLPDGQLPPPSPSLRPLPQDPYHPLTPLGRADRSLLIGREKDLLRFANELDNDATRGIWVAGGAGVGKTSFVQAGVLPFLEEEAVGYRVWRDRTEATPDSELSQPNLALRASRDLIAQLALSIARFAAKPYSFETPTGRHVVVDLPDIVRSFLSGSTSSAIASSPLAPETAAGSTGETDAAALWTTLNNRPESFAELMESLTEALPFEGVLVFEEMEDLFVGSRQDARLQSASRLLASLETSAARLKLIFTMRIELLGRALTAFPDLASYAWPRHLLEELNEDQLRTLVVAPSVAEPLPFSSESPAAKYGIRVDVGGDDALVRRAMQSARRHAVPAVSEVLASAQILAGNAGAARVIAATGVPRLPDSATAKLIDASIQRALRGRDAASFQSIAEKLGQRHSDGVISRALVSPNSLRSSWRGATALEDAINALSDDRTPIVELQPVLHEGREEIFVTASQDAVVRYVAERPKQAEVRQLKERTSNYLWIGIPLAIFLFALAFFAYSRMTGRRLSEEQARTKKIAESAAVFKKQVEEAEVERAFVAKKAYSALLAEGLGAIRAGNALRARQLLAGQESKTFEWQWVWRQLESQRHTLVGQPAAVAVLAYSPDGKMLAAADEMGVVRLWDMGDRPQVGAILRGPQGPIYSLVFSNDGKTLYAGTTEKAIHAWDAKTGEAIENLKSRNAFEGHEEGTYIVAPLGKDGVVSVGAHDKQLTIWDAGSGKSKNLQKLEESATALATSKDGDVFAFAVENVVEVWDSKGPKKVQSWKADGGISSLAFSPDGATLLAGIVEIEGTMTFGRIRRFDPKTGKETAAPLEHGSSVRQIAWSPKGDAIYSAGEDWVVRAWDAKLNKQTHAFPGHVSRIRSLAASSDGQHLASAGHDSSIKVWDLNAGKYDEPIQAHKSSAVALDFSPGDRVLATAGRDGLVKLWNPLDGSSVGEMKHDGPIASLAFRQRDDDLILAVAVEGKTPEVKAWRLTQDDKKAWVWKEAYQIKAQANVVAFDQPGDVLGVGGDRTLGFYNAATGAVKTKPAMQVPPVRALSFGFGHQAIIGDALGHLVIMDVEKGQFAMKPIQVHNGAVRGVASLIENRIATVGDDHILTIRRINKEGQIVLERLERNHHQPMTSIAAHPDGATFATTSYDRTIKIWNAEDGLFGAERLTLTGHDSPVVAAAFGRRLPLLASVDHDGKLKLWRAGPLKK